MKPSIGRAVLGGFMGTVLLTLMMRFLAPVMTGQKMDMPGRIGDMLSAGPAVGMILHFVNGSVIFALIYVLVFYRILPGTPWIKGLLFGVVLWLLLETAMLPMMGGGIFNSRMGGNKMVLAALAGHVVYGLTLGAIAGLPKQQSLRTMGAAEGR